MWYDLWRYDINSCVIFRNNIHKTLETNCICFMDKMMKDNNDLFHKKA